MTKKDIHKQNITGKVKNRKTGEIVKGRADLQDNKVIIILEDGQIVSTKEYEMIEFSSGESVKESDQAMKEWIKKNKPEPFDEDFE